MNSNQAQKLSGPQALEEYFTSLLDDELELEEPSITAPLVAVSTPKDTELEPQRQTDYHSAYTELGYNEFEAPDLKDVQKLLDKMDSTDLADEPEIVTQIEQNTANIRLEDNELVTASEPQIEEVQEWEIETEVVSLDEMTVEIEAEIKEPEINANLATEVQLDTAIEPSIFDDWQSTERNVDFQVLYFDVNGVTFAVPLDELGGIHKTAELSHLIGRPGWYLGLQTNKDNQYDVVDTAKWVMADRLQDESHKDAYQYIVMLGDSSWGLAATELKGTESLSVESVRWREQAGKRPWLAGMVKEKMCALIHVEAMITMITAGMDVKSLDS